MSKILINITIFILFILVCVYYLFPYIHTKNTHGKEGFQYLGYPPFAGPGYFFNFPTREYPPLKFAGYDMRGPPGCPYFGRCGEQIRSGQQNILMPVKPYFYDYWWPIPLFRYDKFYGANGKLHNM